MASSLGRRRFKVGSRRRVASSVQSSLAEVTVQGLALVGSGVLTSAALLAFVNLGLTLANAWSQEPRFSQFVPFDREVGSGPATVTRTRLQLNQLLALGLELLVISDLVETLVNSTADYSYDTLYKLAVIASIRTILSYALGVETSDIIQRAKDDSRLDGLLITQQTRRPTNAAKPPTEQT